MFHKNYIRKLRLSGNFLGDERVRINEVSLYIISHWCFQLLEATTSFSVSQSEHIRELQQWKETCGSMVDLQKYTRLQIDLVDKQRSLHELQQLLQTKDLTSTQVFKGRLSLSFYR